MKRPTLLVASIALGVLPLFAQNVESLALPDVLDARTTSARLTARIAELNREAALQQSLNNLARAAQIRSVVATLQSWQNATTPLPPAGVEVHAVSFYEGEPANKTARIVLTREAAPVVLFLNAYESITWTLDPLPARTVLLGVVVVSYDPQVVNGVPNGVPVIQIDRTNGGTYYGRATELEGRADLTGNCLTRLGLLPATFTSSYTAPAGPFEVGPGSTEWLDQWVLTAAVGQGQLLNNGTWAALTRAAATQTFFPLLTPALQSTGPSRIVFASPLGVQSGTLLSLSGISNYDIAPGPSVFVLRNRAPATLNLANLVATPIPPNPALPPFSWVNGITFDWLRNRLLVTSFGGVGYLYAYDLAAATWSVVTSLNNVDLGAIVHHPLHDAIFALDPGTFGGGVLRLRRYDNSGTLVSTQNLGLSTWGAPSDNFQLYVLGSNIVALGPGKRLFGAVLRHLFVIDPTTADILFAGVLAG